MPLAPDAIFYEIKPTLLNLVMKKQFSGISTDDAAAHLNNFVELCEMQKYKSMPRDPRYTTLAASSKYTISSISGRFRGL